MSQLINFSLFYRIAIDCGPFLSSLELMACEWSDKMKDQNGMSLKEIENKEQN
jgi:hypothetical protein